jgi:energy-coupling factor transporter ATP-binding protein EcfA2
MYLKSLTVQDVRGFTTGESPFKLDFERPDGTFAGWTVIAGRNGSGKSTLLRAIALALAGPDIARSLMPSGFDGWISHNSDSATVRAAFTVGQNDALSSKGAPPKKQAWAGLTWDRLDDGPVPRMNESLPPSAPKLTARRGPWSENPVGWFVAGYGPFRRLTGAAAEAQRLMLGTKRTAALVTLFDETASLAESTWWLQELYPKVLEGDPSAMRLQKEVLDLLDDGLLPDGSRVTGYDSRGLSITQNGHELVLEEMSDGYRVVSALVLDIVRRLYASLGNFELLTREDGTRYCAGEGVVLIDEVDVHLHVSWQQRIGFWLREHFPNIQFIVSTHSPFIAQAASPRGLLRLPAPSELDREPQFIAEPSFSRIVNGGADRAVMSELFGLESSYSAETLERRARWRESAFNDRTSESASSDSKASALREELGVTPSDEVVRALKELDEAIGLLRD